MDNNMDNIKITGFHNYVKNVIDSEFQMELKSNKGKGRALIIGAIDEDVTSMYTNGGLVEIGKIISALFNTMSYTIDDGFGKNAFIVKEDFVYRFLKGIDDDWIDIFVSLRRKKKKKK